MTSLQPGRLPVLRPDHRSPGLRLRAGAKRAAAVLRHPRAGVLQSGQKRGLLARHRILHQSVRDCGGYDHICGFPPLFGFHDLKM